MQQMIVAGINSIQNTRCICSDICKQKENNNNSTNTFKITYHLFGQMYNMPLKHGCSVTKLKKEVVRIVYRVLDISNLTKTNV